MAPEKEYKKVTTNTIQKMKAAGEKISMITAYDFSFAKIIDETIEFKNDPQKTEAISELAESFNFASTHAVIAKLNQWQGNFLDEEKQQLLQIAMSNSQVGGIMSDNDVHEFYTQLRQSVPWFGDPVADAFDKMFPDIDPVPF